jgi:hypothetical protein
MTKSNIEQIRNMLNKDARYTVGDLARLTNMSLARVHGILKKHLRLRKIIARWIPYLLTDIQKRTRVANAEKLHKLYPKCNNKGFPQLRHWFAFLSQSGNV